MMEGIIILNTITNPIMGWTWTVGAIIFFVILLFIAACILSVAITDDPIWGMFLIVVLIAALFLIPLGETKIGSYDTYQVILEDNVSFNDFIDRYEILEQDGRIFTIQERENNR